jgi:cell wall-associated NlpC family hydrolase
MPRYSAEQIYGFARRAGFTPDEAATMTAVSLAESGGNSKAHNPHGEDSRGLWQINGKAHPAFLTKYNLYDPLDNAKAAFEISHRGEDISPWTTTHGGLSSQYVRFKDEAQAAAVAYGDGSGRGVWSGTTGYGDHEPAHPGLDAPGLDTQGLDVQGVALHDVAGPVTSGGGGNAALDTFLRVAKAQVGDRYVFGAEVTLSDPNPSVWDCSELTQWAAHQAGATIPDGATAQYLDLKEKGLLIPVDQAKNTPGALLFHFDGTPRPGDGRASGAHVAISLGNGKVVEAANHIAGVREADAGSRFDFAAVIPGISDGSATPLAEPDALGTSMADPLPTTPVVAQPLPELGGPDSDHDGLSDALERRYGLDPLRADTDGDGLSDADELVKYHTDPRSADTDGDRLNDAFELAQGLDPTSPDSDADGHLDGSLGPLRVDTDHDGLDDSLEQVLGFNPALADSDSDGFSDALEYHSGSNALDAHDTPLLHHDTGAELPGSSSLPSSSLPGSGLPGTTQTIGTGQLDDVSDLH